ncbi:MAG: TonB C-terminal domain-containing protein [Steroidobacteraceae bacterium]
MSKSWQRHVPLVAGTLIVVLVASLLIWFVRNMLNSKPVGPTRAVEQKITMIRPPPPPETPPPPPPEEKIEEPLEQSEPEQAPQQADASPAEQLGLDADGAAGADGFGLAARKGGRDLVGTGTGAFVWYTSLLKDSIQQALSDDEKVRKGTYQVNVRVWLAADGRVERIKLTSTSGNLDLDSAIENALARLGKVREVPPLEMPQPITLRIVSRG